MNRPTLAAALGVVLTSVALGAQPPAAGLDIYWIDVEGGAATLVVTPERRSILMDAGWARSDERDALRIQDAMQDAGVDRIDYFIASHFHGDHVGGLPALAARVPIGQLVDHGDSVEQATERGLASWNAYIGVAEGRRRTIAPGDKLPLRDVEFSFVLARGATPERPLMPTGPNPHCGGAWPYPDDSGENASSVGYLVSLGAFQFLNLGDVTRNVQYELACPENKLGEVDLYQVPHHGNGVAPQLTWAPRPRGGRHQQRPAQGRQRGGVPGGGREPAARGRLAVPPRARHRSRLPRGGRADGQPHRRGRLPRPLDQGHGQPRRPRLHPLERPQRRQPDVPLAVEAAGGSLVPWREGVTGAGPQDVRRPSS